MEHAVGGSVYRGKVFPSRLEFLVIYSQGLIPQRDQFAVTGQFCNRAGLWEGGDIGRVACFNTHGDQRLELASSGVEYINIRVGFLERRDNGFERFLLRASESAEDKHGSGILARAFIGSRCRAAATGAQHHAGHEQQANDRKDLFHLSSLLSE